MTDRNKFEEMLERLVNEDREGAEELFHEIVVEKSREIYEGLLEDEEVEETTDETVDEATDEEVDESEEDLDEATDEEVEESEEEVDEATDEEVEEATDEEVEEMFDEPAVEGDPADDMMADLEMGDGEEGDDDGEEASDEDLEDRMVDLEKELDDLRQQFNDEMGGGDDKGDDEDAGDMDDMGDDDEDDADSEDESIDLGVEEATDEEATEATDKEFEEADKSEAETMREYVEKVTAKMGDNGANTKSTVASANDMGGDASNLVAGGEADSKGTTGGLEGNSPKEDSMGNINVPGGKAAKSMKAQPKGHGAEKKSAGETADNKKSTIGS